MSAGVRWSVGLFMAGVASWMLTTMSVAGTYNPDRNVGDVVPAWRDLEGTDGARHGWEEFANRDFVVVVFTCNSCPYAVDYERRIEALANRAAAPGSRFAVVAINANRIPEDALPAMRTRAEARRFSFPYLFDESQGVARSFGAVRTPECFVLDRDRRIVYMGAIDDATDEARVAKRYLDEALDDLLAGRPVAVSETAPVGCMIRFERVRRAPPPPRSVALPISDDGLPGEGPLRRDDWFVKGWQSRRERWSRSRGTDRAGVVFLGDSITEGWGDDFQGRFEGLVGANRGISGDTTRGMLVRLQDDVLSLEPKVIVILAGTNDVEVGIPPEAIARNIRRMVDAIREHDRTSGRSTHVVLCRVFPSSGEKHRPADTIRKVNAAIEAAVRGDRQVTLLDTHTLFADGAGDAIPEFFPDLLHLNAAGYAKWAGALRPVLATLGCLETTPDAFEPEEGFESLFNGSDLTGWGFRPTPARPPQPNPKPDAPVWADVVKAIDFNGKTESPDGRYVVVHGRLVVTTPPEGRRIQQLWTTREFDGDFQLRLQFRATPNADSGVFIRQPQLQCRDYALAGPWKDLRKYRPQDWNDLEVTVVGTVAKATCNGEPIPGEMKIPETGPIGLEGDRGQMEYRRIRLKRLASP